jgi:hypothetical protein
MTNAHRLSDTARVPAAATFTRVAHALGAPATVLYQHDDPDGSDIRVVCASPPLVVFGPRLTGSTAHPDLSDGERRFLLAHAAEQCLPARIIAAGLPYEAFAELMDALTRLFAGRRTDSAEQDQALRTSLPIRVRSRLTELLAAHRMQPSTYVERCQRAADRAGLLISGDLAAALRHGSGVTPECPVPRHYVELILQPAYTEVRQRLGISRGDTPR